LSKRSEKFYSFLTATSNEIVKIINEKPTTENPANWAFYKDKLRRINTLILLIKERWARFVDLEITEEYDDTVKATRKVLKKTGKFYSDTYQAVAANIIKEQAKLDMFAALNIGEAQINRLFRLTQQQVLKEQKINISIKAGLRKGRVSDIQGILVRQLNKKVGEGGFVVTINAETGKRRHYKPETYARLVTRTRLAEAQSEATVNTTLGYGEDLVRVSDHNTTTAICVPYEGKIFSISGRSDTFPPLIRRPAFHPNCLHRLNPVIVNENTKRGQNTIEQQKQITQQNNKETEKYLANEPKTDAQKKQHKLIEAQNDLINKRTNL
jgi:hypothetical protein